MERHVFEVRLRGRLGRAALQAFAGLVVEITPTTTVLIGALDQDELHALLDRVHAALESGSRHETSVSEAAMAWGFRHLGRFSGTYFRRFGEYPGQTLRASSGR